MRGVDAEHRRARTDQRIERDDRLVGVLGGHAVHHVDLSADTDDRTCWQCIDRGEDPLGGTDLISELTRLVRALGVDDHDTVGVLGAEGLDV